MEIQSLRLLIAEEDVNHLAALFQASNPKVKNLQLRIAPEGVRLSGTYQMLVGVNFATLWELSVQDGKLAAHLVQFQAAGLGGGLLRTAFMSALTELIKKEDALRIDGETLILDAEQLLTKKGVPAQLNLASVRCETGLLMVEAGSSPG